MMLVASMAAMAAPQVAADGLQQLQQPGRIRVAVYKDFPPYSDNGEGIDVDIARALAERLGVALDLMWVQASDESMDDDLRNAVWKGHYLGGGTADVMLHVPVDPHFAARNDKVKITGAYHRESLQVAHDTRQLPELTSVDDLVGKPIGVETATAQDSFLLGTAGGRLQPNVVHFRGAPDAMAALRRGEVVAVMAQRAELEDGLKGTDREVFVISSIPTPGLTQRGWIVGVALKAENAALAARVEQALTAMLEDGTIAAIFKRHGVSHFRP
ncbi:MAG: transporter substrate-binding domain-containing protein [Betaproteobacteria bacterium]|nr:transporter substrate-binding domain-containing protein [Betaproteobacteria bacterium]